MTGITTGWANVSDYAGRSMIINVTGAHASHWQKTSHYQLKVPYSSLSQTIQQIGRSGGKITQVTMTGRPTPLPPAAMPIFVPPTSSAPLPAAPPLVEATPQPRAKPNRTTQKPTGFKSARPKK
jgi:phycocyanin-associated, rod